MTVMAINTVFVVFRAFQAGCCLKVTYGEWFITIFAAVSASTCTVVNINNFLHLREIIGCRRRGCGDRPQFLSKNTRVWLVALEFYFLKTFREFQEGFLHYLVKEIL